MTNVIDKIALVLVIIGALNWGLIGILIGSTIIMVLGIFDDIKPLSAKFKFLIQILAAALPVLLNVRVFAISNPFAADTLIRLPDWFSITFSILWIVGITNAVNLIDGLDGLAAGVSSIAAVALLSILLLQHNITGSLIVLAAALAGGCFGFLPYNFNPAKIFMGDTGATFLGFILACISVQGPFKTYVAFAVPMLVLGLPIFAIVLPPSDPIILFVIQIVKYIYAGSFIFIYIYL